jgi:hypothetical protein
VDLEKRKKKYMQIHQKLHPREKILMLAISINKDVKNETMAEVDVGK